MTTTSHTPKPFSMMADALESAADSFEQAAANAPESARRAARVTKRALGIGVFKAFYGIAYGLVYSGVFVTELLPEQSTVRRALTEGAEAAISARHKAGSKSKAKVSFEPLHEEEAPAPVVPVVPVKAVAKRPAKAAKTAAIAAARPARKAVKKRAEKFDEAVKGLTA
jgi:hypothetical protein